MAKSTMQKSEDGVSTEDVTILGIGNDKASNKCKKFRVDPALLLKINLEGKSRAQKETATVRI